MSDFDKSFTDAIVKQLKHKLLRDLSVSELNVFTMKRSGIAYEMIMDTIKDDKMSREQLEAFVKNVVEEHTKK